MSQTPRQKMFNLLSIIYWHFKHQLPFSSSVRNVYLGTHQPQKAYMTTSCKTWREADILKQNKNSEEEVCAFSWRQSSLPASLASLPPFLWKFHKKVEQHKLCEGCRAAACSLEAVTALWRLPSDHPFTQLEPQTSLTKNSEASFPWTSCAGPHFNICLQILNLLGEIYSIRDLSQLGWLTAGLCLAYF